MTKSNKNWLLYVQVTKDSSYFHAEVAFHFLIKGKTVYRRPYSGMWDAVTLCGREECFHFLIKG